MFRGVFEPDNAYGDSLYSTLLHPLALKLVQGKPSKSSTKGWLGSYFYFGGGDNEENAAQQSEGRWKGTR